MIRCKDVHGIYVVHTNLAADDRRVDDEEDEFVQQLVQETYTGVQECSLQGCHGGFQFSFHIGLSDDHILQSERERVLL